MTVNPQQIKELTPTATVMKPMVTTTQEGDLSGVVSLWHSWNESETEVLVNVIENFQALHPKVQFDVLYVPFDDLEAKYESALEEQGGPNLLLGPSQWGPSLFDKELIQDISKFVSSQLVSSVNQAAMDEVRYKSVIIGLPYTMGGVLLFRNKEIIKDAPVTFDELVSESQSVTSGGIVGAYLDRGIFFSGAHLNGIGGQLAGEDGNPAFNNEKGMEWIDLLESFSDAGPTEFNGDQDSELFKQGKVGFIIEDGAKTGSLAEAIRPESLSIDPWPEYHSGYLSGYIQTENLYLNAAIRDQDQLLSMAFVEFFLTEETQLTLSEAGFIPVIGDVQVTDPFIEQSMQAFEMGTAYPIFPDVGIYWQPLEDAMVSVFEGDSDIVLALQQANDIVQSRLDEVRKGEE